MLLITGAFSRQCHLFCRRQTMQTHSLGTYASVRHCLPLNLYDQYLFYSHLIFSLGTPTVEYVIIHPVALSLWTNNSAQSLHRYQVCNYRYLPFPFLVTVPNMSSLARQRYGTCIHMAQSLVNRTIHLFLSLYLQRSARFQSLGTVVPYLLHIPYVQDSAQFPYLAPVRCCVFPVYHRYLPVLFYFLSS
jgi:hypothetical protein